MSPTVLRVVGAVLILLVLYAAGELNWEGPVWVVALVAGAWAWERFLVKPAKEKAKA